MALVKTNFQVTNHILQPQILTGLLENGKLQQLLGRNKSNFWPWKKEKVCKIEDIVGIQKEEKKYTLRKSSCRKRLPECPEHICCGTNKCIQEPVKKSKWYSFKKPPPPKPKPTNYCPSPPPCKKETFKEYIFGVEEPLPDPETCRKVYKIKQQLMECDSRPEDPRYQVTEGDVLIYTEPPRFEHTANIEPKPTRPPFLRLPAPVICKMVSDSVSCLDCYCACVAVPREPCETNLCPVHRKPFKFPYDEMKPRNRRIQYLTHKRDWCWDPCQNDPCWDPSKHEVCDCAAYPTAPSGPGFMSTDDNCTLGEAIQKLRQNETQPKQDPCATCPTKMSRTERLNVLGSKSYGVTLPDLTSRISSKLRDPTDGCCAKK